MTHNVISNKDRNMAVLWEHNGKVKGTMSMCDHTPIYSVKIYSQSVNCEDESVCLLWLAMHTI